jgi:uncharacterized DUF497 family protein
MGLLFEWDPKKARLNVKTHGISFDEASTAFRDLLRERLSIRFTPRTRIALS